jgi:transcriptional regulator of acetoin/glycerol metabolism
VATVLETYGWPGNVRELRNVMERASILCPPGSEIRPEHLPPLRAPSGSAPGASTPSTMEDAERRAVEAALEESGGNIHAAARRLGLSRNTLYRKIRKYRIDAD